MEKLCMIERLKKERGEIEYCIYHLIIIPYLGIRKWMLQ